MRLTWLGMMTLGAAASLTAIGEREAKACGGCFHEPQAPTETPSMITGHRMILSISSKQTTLYDQIKYSGNPKTFAWVLPISGLAEVGLSADIVFSTLGAMTETRVIPPPMNCPSPPAGSCNSRSGGGFGSASDNSPSAGAAPNPQDAASPAPPPVTVTKEETVGPYETVQLRSTDPQALNDWLTSHGFAIPDDVKPIIKQYVDEHFDFLAMKLVPGAGVQSMRPVRVTTAGAAPVLPLRMVAAGTGATVGITLWVIGEGRYEPQNFPMFKIDTDELVYDWNAGSSNFVTLRAQKTAASGGRGWEVENSTDISQFQVTNMVTYANFPQYDAGADYPGSGGDSDAGNAGDAGPAAKSPSQMRQADLDALFAGIPSGNARVTRLRGDLAHAALTTDLSLQASADQATLPLSRQITKELNEPMCPIYQGCTVVGQGPRSQAQEAVKNSGNETFSCATTLKSPRTTSTFALIAACAAVAGIAVIRGRRRRGEK